MYIYEWVIIISHKIGGRNGYKNVIADAINGITGYWPSHPDRFRRQTSGAQKPTKRSANSN